VLPGNHPISGLADLQKFLLEVRRDQFAKALVSKMLIYALGRSLELADEPLVEELSVQFAKDDYRLYDLIKNIVMSEPFSSR
jgi:patatin-like phospholipase/acyl hydrolase